MPLCAFYRIIQLILYDLICMIFIIIYCMTVQYNDNNYSNALLLLLYYIMLIKLIN